MAGRKRKINRKIRIEEISNLANSRIFLAEKFMCRSIFMHCMVSYLIVGISIKHKTEYEKQCTAMTTVVDC